MPAPVDSIAMDLVKAPRAGDPANGASPTPQSLPDRGGVGNEPERRSPGVKRLMAVMELTKPRITRLVTMTSMVGFVLSMRGTTRAGGWGQGELATCVIGCLLGTYLSSAGANALNQWVERVRDGRMRRTARRPLPEGRLTSLGALTAGVALSAMGLGALCVMCGPAPAAVSLVTILIYVGLYTPAKPLTPLSTLIGAIPGALPPLIGWTAAAGLGRHDAWAGLGEAGGWALFALMAVWQIPHFLALAWMYQDDYAAGGHRMLPLYDRTGRLTAGTIVAFTVLLVPATIAPAVFMPDRLGVVYISIAAISGLLFLGSTFRLAAAMNAVNARKVFLGSVMHLPLLLAAIVGEVIVRAVL